jgi:hypothetical protein
LPADNLPSYTLDAFSSTPKINELTLLESDKDADLEFFKMRPIIQVVQV